MGGGGGRGRGAGQILWDDMKLITHTMRGCSFLTKQTFVTEPQSPPRSWGPGKEGYLWPY